MESNHSTDLEALLKQLTELKQENEQLKQINLELEARLDITGEELFLSNQMLLNLLESQEVQQKNTQKSKDVKPKGFSGLLLKYRTTNPGWLIIGLRQDKSHHVLAIIEPPLSLEFVRKFASQVAEEMGIVNITDRTLFG